MNCLMAGGDNDPPSSSSMMHPSLEVEVGNAEDDNAMILPPASSPAPVDTDPNTPNVAAAWRDQPLSRDPAIIAQETRIKFPVGKVFHSLETLVKEANDFAENNYFRMRKSGRNTLLCSRSENANSRNKKAGGVVMQRAETAMACDCPYKMKFSIIKSMSPKVTVSQVNPLHNHACILAQAAVHIPKVRGDVKRKRQADEMADLRNENTKLSGEIEDLRDENMRLNDMLEAVREAIR
mmetsp:Transcript_12093/g.26394  ORF Transcript_12093/g.26394 Transcript_12093/m.26394 type:complete len:237 (-) Transcript_12093:457-1167(-)